MPSASETKASPFRAVEGGVRVRVRLSPRASRARCAGLVADPSGGVALKIAVPAAPVDGAANAALIRFLADSWRLPRTAITLVGGASDRQKTLMIEGAAATLMARLNAWSAAIQAQPQES
ncbi:MAG TPA: DUF167 domain-containing protein [Defluviicoccus sp.]|nr:DUF167 domain-containing protein [Defluviicoccus sp.]